VAGLSKGLVENYLWGLQVQDLFTGQMSFLSANQQCRGMSEDICCSGHQKLQWKQEAEAYRGSAVQCRQVRKLGDHRPGDVIQ